MPGLSPQEVLTIKVELNGARQVQVEAATTAKAVRTVGTAADSTARSLNQSARRGFLMNQALFTMRRFAYAATLALGALTTGAVALGIRFNATMEQNQVAFEYFLGSASAANREIDYLYELAARTPFEFGQVVDASRKFLAFGFDVDQVNQIMTTLGDTIAGLGLSGEAIDRAVLALGQMKAAGRVLGGEIRQLTELGIPALQILQRELGLSSDQIARIGELRIPADVAIAALVRGLEKEFEGMAELQSRTFTGQLTTLRDYTAKALGALTLPLFNKLRDDILPMAVKVAEALSEGFEAGGFAEAVRRVDAVTNSNGKLIRAWERLRAVGRDLGKLWRESLWPILSRIFTLVKEVGIPFLGLLAATLGLLADNTGIVTTALQLYVTWKIYSIGKTWLLALVTWFGKTSLGNALKRLVVWIYAEVTATQVYTVWKGRAIMWTKRFITWINLLALRLYIGLIPALFAAATATWAFTIALLANPITWVILAVVALAAAIIFLAIKFERFRNFLKDWGPAFIPILGQFWLLYRAIKFVGDKIDWLWGKFNKLKDIGGGILGFPGNALGWAQDKMPLLAEGGTLSPGAFGVVGEAGPEIAFARPSGGTVIVPASRVSPLPQTFGLGGGGSKGPTIVKVYLDRRQIAEAVADETLDRRARR